MADTDHFQYFPLFTVGSDLVWLCAVYLVVLAASGPAATNGIVLVVRQALQTKLNQDNFL